MTFTVDKQTLEDLNILGKYKNNSIFNVFCNTYTRGGERLLEQMFRFPLTDVGAINKRAAIFSYFMERAVNFPFTKELLDIIEPYLNTAGHPNAGVAILNTCRRKFLDTISVDEEYRMIYTGLFHTIEFLNVFNDFNEAMEVKGTVFQEIGEEIRAILHHKRLEWVLHRRDVKTLSFWELARYDHCFRAVCRHRLKRLLEILYQLDVYITVARVAKEKKFACAKAVPTVPGQNRIMIRQLFHPALPGAVANDMAIDHRHNVVFLTGANMAGKSTLMKSFAIAVYLAHMGFPVAAEKMEFSVQDGLYTSINVSDNLNMGYSHFYAEVLRVKQVAEEVAAGKNLVVIFDELFKGTNVKDAYDATVAVTEAFSKKRNCSYIISTHIIEAGHALQEQCDSFRFVYLPTVMCGKVPTYTYRLEEGITDDRHGMMIIRNERIVEIIRGE